MKMNELKEYKKLLERMNRQELAEERTKIASEKDFWNRAFGEIIDFYPTILEDLVKDCYIKLAMINAMDDEIERRTK